MWVFSIFGHLFGAQNGHPENDPRAFVLAKAGAGKGEREGDTEKDRLKHTESSQLPKKVRKLWAELACVYPYTR